MKYVINLSDKDKEESYEITGDNVAKVTVYDHKGNDVSNESRVMIQLSKNALLGLGTELIRLTHKYGDGKHTHLYPVDPSLVSQNMGIYLTPDSSELIIGCCDSQPIEEYLKEKPL